jgi:streptogramin lyase
MRFPKACVVWTALALAVAAGPAAVARADPPSAGTLVATLPAPTARDVEAGFGSIWVANGPTRTVTRIDPRTNAVLTVIPVPDVASVLAFGAGSVWLTSLPGNSLTRIDPVTDTVTGTISLAPRGAGAIGVTFARGFVWVADSRGVPTSSVAKVDPRTMAIADVIPVGDEPVAGPTWITSGHGSLWAGVVNIDAVLRLDPETDAVTATIPVAGACGMIAPTGRAIWVAGGGGDGCFEGLTRIDPVTNAVTAVIPTDGVTNQVVAGGHSVWFGTDAPDALGRLDPRTGRLTGTLALPGPPFGMAVGFCHVWITDRDNGLLYKVRPTRQDPEACGCR